MYNNIKLDDLDRDDEDDGLRDVVLRGVVHRDVVPHGDRRGDPREVAFFTNFLVLNKLSLQNEYRHFDYFVSINNLANYSPLFIHKNRYVILSYPNKWQGLFLL